MKLKYVLNEINKVPSKFIKLVDVDKLNYYRTQPKSKINNYDLEDDIEKYGIKEPMMLIYFVHDNKLGLYDGHHRLDIAIDLGIKKIPAYVELTGKYAPMSAKSVEIPVNWKGKDYLNPSEVGL